MAPSSQDAPGEPASIHRTRRRCRTPCLPRLAKLARASCIVIGSVPISSLSSPFAAFSPVTRMSRSSPRTPPARRIPHPLATPRPTRACPAHGSGRPARWRGRPRFQQRVTAISGNAELAMESLPPDAAARNSVHEDPRGRRYVATLTRQLLRLPHRQTLHPRVVDLNTVVAGCEPGVAGLIGEARFRLETHSPRNASPILGGPGQIEQVLVNLVVNSRDAMPGGGRVQIETTEVVDRHPDPIRWPGLSARQSSTSPYATRDPAWTAKRASAAFDPFFTTKAQAEKAPAWLRDGLRNRGAIRRLDLHRQRAGTRRPPSPRTSARLPPRRHRRWHRSSHPRLRRLGKGETVLVVEDESAVREPLARAPHQQGYVVLEAKTVFTVSRSAHNTRTPSISWSAMSACRGSSALTWSPRLRAERPGLRAMFACQATRRSDGGAPAPLIAAQLLEKPFTVLRSSAGCKRHSTARRRNTGTGPIPGRSPRPERQPESRLAEMRSPAASKSP